MEKYYFLGLTLFLIIALNHQVEPARRIKKRIFVNIENISRCEGPCFHAVVVNSLVFISGQQGILPNGTEEDNTPDKRRKRQAGEPPVTSPAPTTADGTETTDDASKSEPSEEETSGSDTSDSEESSESESSESESSEEMTFQEEAEQALENIILIVERLEGNRNNIVMTRNYITDKENLSDLKRAYNSIFKVVPVQTTVVIEALRNNANVEIEAYAILNPPSHAPF